MGIASVIVSLLIAMQLKLRMVPFADRDQFAVEIYLRPDAPLERTAAVADSVYRVLHDDARVKSVTSFVGCSSPRFQMSYAPQIAGKNYAQFIINTTSSTTPKISSTSMPTHGPTVSPRPMSNSSSSTTRTFPRWSSGSTAATSTRCAPRLTA